MTVASLYICFGLYCFSIWGEDTAPLVIDNVFKDKLSPSWLSYLIIVFFCSNLLFTYPLVLYPAHIIIESVLYKGWEKSKKRQWSKNFTRTILVTITVVLTLSIGDKINNLLSLNGAIFCTPVAFLFPAMFHLKAVAETNFQKGIDISIIVFSCIVMVYCTYDGIVSWNKD